MRRWLARNAGGRNAANVRRTPTEVARARRRRYESPPPLHADRLHRDLRLPDERGRHRADARPPGRARLHAHQRRRGRRRDPAQHLRHPRARRGARPRPPGRARAPQAPPARRAARRDRLHGAAPAREARPARALAAAGVREVVFLGQTVNAYHDGTWDFAELLRQTATVPGILRLRFTSPHPSDMSARVIEAMAECPAVAPQLHLPVQSGSDRVLGRMGREYTRAEYEDLVARLRARVPGLALSTDVIVGFPGEDEEDFASTEALVRRVCYDAAFLFKYSQREGTRAWKWGDTVPEDEKGRRLQRLVALQESISAETNRRLVGTEVGVLVEGPARRTAGWMAGKSPQMKTVVFPGPAAPGDVVRVRIEAATSHTLTGRQVVA